MSFVTGESIYGGEFEDENFDLKCDREGRVVFSHKCYQRRSRALTYLIYLLVIFFAGYS